jgi:hypothetical protein
MKKYLIITSLIIVLSAIILSGCNEQDNSIDIEKVELLNYNITTEWTITNSTDNTTEYYEESGFYHNITEEAQAKYIINGTIKNIAGKKLMRIRITAKFFDKDGNHLTNTSTIIYNIPKSKTEEFEIIQPRDLAKYFNEIENIEFEIVAFE